jgi:hypothetical protein
VSVNVSPNTLERALRILDALIKSAESAGWEAHGKHAGENPASHLLIEDAEIPVRITKKVKRALALQCLSKANFFEKEKTASLPPGKLCA